ncbi:MAG TPA: hypothetical protein VLL52_10795 [Anaerolineae bacterium]|nr:hypothetical protein [Anaerolineae bacterium]
MSFQYPASWQLFVAIDTHQIFLGYSSHIRPAEIVIWVIDKTASPSLSLKDIVKQEMTMPRDIPTDAKITTLLAPKQVVVNNLFAMKGKVRVQLSTKKSDFAHITILVIEGESEFVLVHGFNENIDFLPIVNSFVLSSKISFDGKDYETL